MSKTRKPTKPMPLSVQNRRSLAILLDELSVSVESVVQAGRKQDWAEIGNLVPVVKSYVRSIKDEVPEGLAKEQITQLDAHAQFIEVWAKKHNLAYVLSNAQAVRPDVQRVRVTLGIGGKDELRASIETLPDGPERDLLEEALRCLEAESPRAAIVMAVCSLENVLRSFYESKTRTDTKKMDFWRVIEEVAKMQNLSESERVLMDLSRPFRNFAAHPSEYNHTKEEAQGIIHLAIAQVKKWGPGRSRLVKVSKWIRD